MVVFWLAWKNPSKNWGGHFVIFGHFGVVLRKCESGGENFEYLQTVQNGSKTGGVAKIRRKIHLLEAPFFEKSWFFGVAKSG